MNRYNKEAAVAQSKSMTGQAFVNDVKGIVTNKRLKDYQDQQLDIQRLLAKAGGQGSMNYIDPIIQNMSDTQLFEYVKTNMPEWFENGKLTTKGKQAYNQYLKNLGRKVV